MSTILRKDSAVKNRCWIKKQAALLVLIAVMLFGGKDLRAQLYWNTNGFTANITNANWDNTPGGTPAGTFSVAWTPGSNIVFTTNSLITCPAAPTVGNVRVTTGTTSWTGTSLQNYSTGGTTKIIDIDAGATLTWINQTVAIAGSGFTKNGLGTWNIGTQGNAYALGLTLNAGSVTINGNNALGGGTLVLNGGVITPVNATARFMTGFTGITVGGNFQIGDAVNVIGGTGNVTFNATQPVSLGAATRTISIGGTALYTFAGAIGSTGGGLIITSSSSGSIIFTNGANTYTGPTTINSGILQAGVINSLPTTTALVFANNATAQFVANGFNTTVGSIAGGGTTGGNIKMGTVNLSTGGANSNTSYGAVISGSGTFTKTGTGTQTLTGANTYTGATTVSGGGLFINGSTNSLSAATVANGATLGGNGTFAGTVSNSGIVSPGSADAVTGTLNTGAATFAANASYKVEVSNVAGASGAVSGWDLLNSSGAITVSATPITINLTGLGGNGFNNNSAYSWVIATGSSIVGFIPANFIITPSGFAGAGTFTIEQSGNSLQIVHTPPSGNSITLSPASQLSAATFCNGVSGNVITLTYVISGTVTAPAIELSNAAGSFLSGTVQLSGTVSGSGPYTITGTIPGGQTAAAAYRVRIISADATPVISLDNLNNFTITNAVTPSVSIAITTGTNPSCNGTGLTFTATPTNGGTPGYQWKKNGTDIGGATSSTYTSTTLITGDIITCLMTPSATCVTAATALSNGITVTVNPLPANPSNPVASAINPSCGANSLNSMSPDANTDFYWQGTVLNGQSTSTATTAPYPVSASGTYYVTALSTNGCWSAGSGSIVLTVSTAPGISVQPVDKSISAGGTTTFSITAANGSGLFQWQVDQGSGFTDVTNGGVYAGATTNILTLTAVPIGYNNYVYQCIVKGGGCADLTSGPATLSVNPVPWEDFEIGTKAGYAIANVTCTAGSWSFNNALLGTSASDYILGLQSARINVNGDISMNFDLTTLGVVKLNHRIYTGDLNSTWRLQASTDNGITWTAYTSPIFTATSTVQTETILINLLGSVRFRIVNAETSGNHRINIDDIYVTTYTGCITPTAQAIFTTVTALSTTSMTINFTAGTGGAGRIVVMKQGSTITGFPTSGITYAASNNFATAPASIATGEKVVYNGTGTSVNVTNLIPNTDYYFQIFEFAGTNCYLISNVSNTGTTTTVCNSPVTNSSSVNTTLVGNTTATISWTNGTGSNRLVVVNAGSAVTGAPVNGTSYSANSSYSVAPAFTPGTGKTVYNSISNTVALTNLASNTVYYVSVFEFNSGSNCYVSTGAPATFTTGSLLSDIASANGESSCVSSVVNGTIASVANGTQVWQFTIRDGGSSSPDADALPTIVNSIVITQGTSNTVTDWTNIQAAALFDGATLISAGVISATTITFTGAPLISVADNTNKTLSLRITLKTGVTIPATIDGKLFRFSISAGNITLAASGTSGKNSSALVATTDITKDIVCVVATRLVFTIQPTTTGQNQLMSPNVVVTAYDANNNIDLDFAQVVSITASGGGLIGTTITATAISGKATFTGIKHSIIGTGYIMTATSGGITAGTSTSYDISTYTTFAPGDFAILAVNNNNTNGVDEIAFVVFNDVVTNTEFFMTDNGYERASAGKWGTSEGIVRLKYIGVPTVPSGTVFVVQGNNASFTMLKCGLNDNANWTFTPNVLTSGSFNINASDQVWFTQGGAWTSASGSLTGQDAVTTGTILYGWSGIDWKANIGNTAPTWTTQGSRIYPQMNCFSTNLGQTTDLGRTKYVGAITATSRLGWISRINDKTNWLTYASNALYDVATPNYAGGGAPCLLSINASVPVDGKWTGAKNVDWFDCNNWDTRSVPGSTISVNIPSTATNPCVVNNVTYASNAIQYNNTADCFNLTVDAQTLSTGNAADVINVNGNFNLQNASTLNMTGGGTFNLQTGSWIKTASTFTSGTGTVSYNSALSQAIAAENYFNLKSTSTGDRNMSTAATIGIAGAFTNGTNAYFFTTSTVDYNGSGAQTIAPFTSATVTGSTYNNLTLSNAGIKSLSGATDVEGVLALNNTITMGLGSNFLNVRSTATKTARVAPVSATASITYGTGRFVVERYFPARRAWRLITAPVTVDATNSLYNSWQVGGASPIGSGTYISGPSETAANGLDVTPQHNFSLKTFNQLTSGFDGVANTKSNRISGIAGTAGVPDNIGYFMFVRGDRTPSNVDAFNQFGTVVETTLRDTGKIQTQNYTFTCNPGAGVNKYTLIGNPYASPVDFALLSRNNVENRFRAWDPGLNAVGGFVIVDMTAGLAITTVPAGGSTTQNQIIQSKQAFIVETIGSSPTVGFGESVKSTANNLNLFRPAPAAAASLIANLYTINANGTNHLADGVLAQYNDNYSMGEDRLDAVKFTNINETFSIKNGRNYFMLERRPYLQQMDTVFFNLNRTRQLNYRFNIVLDNIIRQKKRVAYLEDRFLKTATVLNMHGSTWVDFTVNSNTGSAAANRFFITFKKVARFNTITANAISSDVSVNWSVDNAAVVDRYEVERSADGINFTKVAFVTLHENKALLNSYDATDFNTTPGVYYYRIKAISSSNDVYDYSDAVQVKITASKAEMYVYPNPVTDNVIGLKMPSAMPTGMYAIRLLTSSGQAVLNTKLQHNKSAGTEQVNYPASITSGTYQLEVTGPDKKQRVINVVIVK